DSERGTRANAAIALARHGDVRGAGVFAEVLKTAAERQVAGSDGEFEQFLALKNCIIAIERTASALNAGRRGELEALLAPIAADFQEPGIRIAARTALNALHDAR